MRNLVHDVRFGLRLLWGNLGFTAVAVLTLALGIAANTTVFSWVDTLLLRPIPGARDAHELAVLEIVTPKGELIENSYPDYRDYRDSLRLVSGVTGRFNSTLRMGEGENGRDVWGELVTGNFFDVLGVKPHLGRFFSKEESADPPAAFPVVVISHRLWQREYRGDPGVLGKSLHLNRRPFTIIGIAPKDFYGSFSGVVHDVWTPLTTIYQLNRANPGMLDNRGTRNQVVFVRLKPGVTMEQARAEVAARARQLAAANPGPNAGLSATLLPVSESHNAGVQALLRRPLHILMAVCAMVLLIVCANVANLLLARATARQKEFGIRLALGAGWRRLAGQLLTETLLVAGAGGAIALLLTPWMSGSLVALLPPVNAPVRFDTAISARALGWTMLVCIASAVLSGLAPLLCSLRPNLTETLNDAGRGERSGARSHRLRGLLVVGEVALAAVALIAGALFYRSFQAARAVQPGFDANHVLVARFQLANTGKPKEQQLELCRRLRERLQSAPGVADVVYADVAPLGFDGGPWQSIEVEGYVPDRGTRMDYYRSLVAPGYFKLLRIPLLEGRDFTERDDASAPRVMIVNQAFAQRFFGGKSPLGRKVRPWGKQFFTVVGLVANARYHHRAGPAEPYFYVPLPQGFATGHHSLFFVRTHGDPLGAVATLRREAFAMDPNAEATDVMPLAEHIGQSLYPLKVAASLLAALGALAVFLAAIGLYSVMAYAVSQRTHEVGIRMALGARPGAVLGMVLRQGMTLAVAGLIVGIVGALAVTRLVSGMLVNVAAADPASFAGAALFLCGIAALASYVPARRATKVDPMVALRWE